MRATGAAYTPFYEECKRFILTGFSIPLQCSTAAAASPPSLLTEHTNNKYLLRPNASAFDVGDGSLLVRATPAPACRH